MSDFGADVRAALKARLAPRDEAAPASVLGAGNDDLAKGRAYLGALADTGFGAPSYPRAYGGAELDAQQVATLRTELAAFAVPDLYPYLVGIELVGPTVLTHGTPEQCARWLPKIASGEEIWCQLFSEPGAGSDLAGLSTHAERHGDVWHARGQKVWTSRGAYSQWGLLLARHDTSVRKHEGITAFAIDMRAPGVDVRPLRQMNGDAHFTEVFLDDAPIPDTDRIGAIGEGWRVALTCLGYERGASTAGSSSGMLDVERLVHLTRERGLLADPTIRDEIARVVCEARVMGYTARRARDTARSGRPGPEGSGMKLRGSRLFRDYTALAARILGPEMTLDPHGSWQTLLLTAPSLSIRGGTDEIQRNIVGERVLGLPGEPRVDRELPYDQLPR
jgi:alkylation response protein AidB-like acyl-CoA dehydrogenase